jgi:hypothetical protein
MKKFFNKFLSYEGQLIFIFLILSISVFAVGLFIYSNRNDDNKQGRGATLCNYVFEKSDDSRFDLFKSFEKNGYIGEELTLNNLRFRKDIKDKAANYRYRVGVLPTINAENALFHVIVYYNVQYFAGGSRLYDLSHSNINFISLEKDLNKIFGSALIRKCVPISDIEEGE